MIIKLESSRYTSSSMLQRFIRLKRIADVARTEPQYFGIDTAKGHILTQNMLKTLELTAYQLEGIKTGLRQISSLPGDIQAEVEVTATGAALLVAKRVAEVANVPLENVCEAWAEYGSVVIPDRYSGLLGQVFEDTANSLAAIQYPVDELYLQLRRALEITDSEENALLYLLDVSGSVDISDMFGEQEVPEGYSVWDVEMSYDEAKDADLFGPADYDELYDRGVNFEKEGAEFSLRNLLSAHYVQDVVKWGLANNRAILRLTANVQSSDYLSGEVYNALTGTITDNS